LSPTPQEDCKQGVGEWGSFGNGVKWRMFGPSRTEITDTFRKSAF